MSEGDERHPQLAQRGTVRRSGKIVQNCHSQAQLYSIPPALCREIAAAVNARIDFALGFFSSASILLWRLLQTPQSTAVSLPLSEVSNSCLPRCVLPATPACSKSCARKPRRSLTSTLSYLLGVAASKMASSPKVCVPNVVLDLGVGEVVKPIVHRHVRVCFHHQRRRS